MGWGWLVAILLGKVLFREALPSKDSKLDRFNKEYEEFSEDKELKEDEDCDGDEDNDINYSA